MKRTKRTYEDCERDALQYKTKEEYKKGNNASWFCAWRNGWLKYICAHMVKDVKWTKEACIAEAKKYTTIRDWKNHSGGSYQFAIKMGFMSEIKRVVKFINLRKQPRSIWTIDACMREAKKYKTKTEWNKNNHNSYRHACRKGWVGECTTHMPLNAKQKWTKQLCIEEAKKYTKKSEWRANSLNSYQTACRNRWINECGAHMEDGRKGMPRKWTKEKILAEAKKYATKKEWIINGNASYQACIRHKMMKEVGAHFRKHIILNENKINE